MNYEPNTIDWKIGDVVIHDADAKKQHMLMRVVQIKEEGAFGILYGTKYIVPPFNEKKNQIYWNQKESLHNPSLFGLKVSQ